MSVCVFVVLCEHAYPAHWQNNKYQYEEEGNVGIEQPARGLTTPGKQIGFSMHFRAHLSFISQSP